MTKVRARRPWIASLGLLTVALAAGGYWYYRAQVVEIETQQRETLAAIGGLRALQIHQWRSERLTDARFLAGSPALIQASALPDPARRHDLSAYLDRRRVAYGGVLIVDPQGAVLAAAGPDAHTASAGPATARAAKAAVSSSDAVLSEAFREPDGTVHVDAAAAVRDAFGVARAVVILRSTAQDYLLPLIQSRPTPSSSAETLVVQRDGNDVVILNAPRHNSAAPMTQRLPLTDAGRPSVQAVLGRRGAVTGRDYRGVEVRADVRPIDGSPWFIIAKIDVAEILGEARYRALVIGVVVFSLILLAAAATAYFYRHRQAALYRDLYQSERGRVESAIHQDRALRESIERFDLAARATFNVIWDHDLLTNQVWRNDNFQALFGYRPEEIDPDYDTWRQTVVHPDDLPRVRASLQAALTSAAGSWSESYRYKRKDGSYASIRDRCLLVRDAAGHPVRLVGAMQDVSHDEQAQGVLRLQSAALNAAANAIVITDRTGLVVWVNPAFTRVTGFSREEAVGRNPRDLIRSGVHEASFYGELWRTILAGHVWCGEITNRRKDGALYVERQTITPVNGPDGQITHFVAIKQDLTEEKRLQAQFQQAQKMEVIGQLAGGIAHDFNNLLTVINMTADLAAATLRHGDPLRKDFGEISRAGERAATLTRQLLAFSRKQILKPGVIDLGALTQGMKSMLQRLIGEDIKLTVTSPNGLGCVKADPGQIEQVIMNLAVNARDAMCEGGKLAIETRDVVIDGGPMYPGLKSGPHVMIAVTDTGIGMDGPTRARIFDPFFTTKEPGKGTGLGLSTVYGIVKQSDGSVFVESEPGRGTTFKIYLPRVSDALLGAVAADTVVRPAAASTGSETILIVEDERAVRMLATRMLKSAGYTVLAAGDAGEALHAVECHTQPVHLMLTDVVMPGLSGRELAARLAGVRPRMKVLYTSGYTDDAILRHGVLDDASCFIGKPYTRVDLLARVRMLLDAERREPGRAPGTGTAAVDFPADSLVRAGGPAVAAVPSDSGGQNA